MLRRRNVQKATIFQLLPVPWRSSVGRTPTEIFSWSDDGFGRYCCWRTAAIVTKHEINFPIITRTRQGRRRE
jgi:hypothetical protein